MRVVRLLMICLASLGALNCAGDDRVSLSLAASVSRGAGARIALADHAKLAWDKACIFAPYTPDTVIDAVTGVQGAAKQAHSIESREDINLLLFVHEGNIAASVAHRRDRGDFGPELVGRCYSREQAVFSVREEPAGSWRTIGPSQP